MFTGKRVGFFILAVVLFAGLGGTALAATITFLAGPNDRYSGDGVSVTSGYNIVDVRYETDTDAESDAEGLINTILFTLYSGAGTETPAPTESVVWARLVPNGAWASCVVGEGGAVTCSLTGEGQQARPLDVEGTEVVAYRG